MEQDRALILNIGQEVFDCISEMMEQVYGKSNNTPLYQGATLSQKKILLDADNVPNVADCASNTSSRGSLLTKPHNAGLATVDFPVSKSTAFDKLVAERRARVDKLVNQKQAHTAPTQSLASKKTANFNGPTAQKTKNIPNQKGLMSIDGIDSEIKQLKSSGREYFRNSVLSGRSSSSVQQRLMTKFLDTQRKSKNQTLFAAPNRAGTIKQQFNLKFIGNVSFRELELKIYGTDDLLLLIDSIKPGTSDSIDQRVPAQTQAEVTDVVANIVSEINDYGWPRDFPKVVKECSNNIRVVAILN